MAASSFVTHADLLASSFKTLARARAIII